MALTRKDHKAIRRRRSSRPAAWTVVAVGLKAAITWEGRREEKRGGRIVRIRIGKRSEGGQKEERKWETGSVACR